MLLCSVTYFVHKNGCSSGMMKRGNVSYLVSITFVIISTPKREISMATLLLEERHGTWTA